MSSALITQLSKMTDKELLNAYNAMVQKSSRIMLREDNDDMSFDGVDKLERIKGKYKYLEDEITKRGLPSKLSIASIDIAGMKEVKEQKIDMLVKKHNLKIPLAEI